MSRAGAKGRENVGMSNRNAPEKGAHRKPKVSLAMTINQGLGGPKVNPKGVADGQPVNIPALPLCFIRVTKMGRRRALLDLLVGTPHWELEIRISNFHCGVSTET